MELQRDQRLMLAMSLSLLLHVVAVVALPPLVPALPGFHPVLQVTLAPVDRPAPKPLDLAPSPAHLRPVPVHSSPQPRLHRPSPVREAPATVPVPAAGLSTETDVRSSSPPLDMSEPAPAVATVPLPEPPPTPVATTRVAAPIPEEVLTGYGETLARQIARYREYPRLAQLRGWEGKVMLRLAIGPGSKLLDLAVSRSSGHKVLDDRAMEMVRQASPLPPLPDGLRGKNFTVSVPVVFELDH